MRESIPATLTAVGKERITWQLGPSQRGSRDFTLAHSRSPPPDPNVFIRTVPAQTVTCLTQRLGQESPPRVPLMPVEKLRTELHN